MTRPIVDVFVISKCGTTAAEPEPAWPAELRLISAETDRIADFAVLPIAARFAEGDAEFAAIVTSSDRETLLTVAVRAAFGISGAAAASIAIIPIDPNLGFLDPTQGAPHGIGWLLRARGEFRLPIFRRSTVRKVGSLREVPDPIVDWTLRAVREGKQIDSWPDPKTTDRDVCRLPFLAPPAPGPERAWLREHLTKAAIAEFDPIPKRSSVDETALRTGLFLWHDFLVESHELSQSIEGLGDNQLGDYWHAIMHRREPDYSNAKYWFRQIGNQPTFRKLRQHADAILEKSTAVEAPQWRDRLQGGSKWDPFAFVDLCEACANDESTELSLAARRIQYAEMALLMSVTQSVV